MNKINDFELRTLWNLLERFIVIGEGKDYFFCEIFEFKIPESYLKTNIKWDLLKFHVWLYRKVKYKVKQLIFLFLVKQLIFIEYFLFVWFLPSLPNFEICNFGIILEVKLKAIIEKGIYNKGKIRNKYGSIGKSVVKHRMRINFSCYDNGDENDEGEDGDNFEITDDVCTIAALSCIFYFCVEIKV